MELQNFILNLEKTEKELALRNQFEPSILIKTFESTARIELMKFLESIPTEELTGKDVDHLYERYRDSSVPKIEDV